MKFIDMLSLAFDTLSHRSMRSWLAILGIVIGVAAIITLVSISLGMSQQISSRLNTLGANAITITAGGQQAQKTGMLAGFGTDMRPPGQGFQNRETNQITFREADTLRLVPGIAALDAQVRGRASIDYASHNSSQSIIGTEPRAFEKTVGVALYNGRYLSTSDQYSTVIGFSVANKTFGSLDVINKQIKIDGIPFRVVGILQETGATMGGSDSSIYIPQRIAKDMFNQTKAVSQIVAVTDDSHDAESVALQITDQLRALHGLQDSQANDFTVSTASSVQSTVSSITDTLTLFLGGIASVALIVGGIGVANTMFMSVLEQTRYIGILKSLGMKRNAVLKLFLLEAGIIGLVGGILGVLLSFGVSAILAGFGLPSVISIELITLGILFSTIVGVVSGLVPARNAASVPPVEALRYE